MTEPSISPRWGLSLTFLRPATRAFLLVMMTLSALVPSTDVAAQRLSSPSLGLGEQLQGILPVWYPVESYDIWRIEPESTLLDFCEDNEGNVYFTGNTGLIRFDGGRWERLTSIKTFRALTLGDQIIVVDIEGLKRINHRFGQTTVELLNDRVTSMGLKRPDTLLWNSKVGDDVFLCTTHYVFRLRLNEQNEIEWTRWYRGECLSKEWKFRRVMNIQGRPMVQLEAMDNLKTMAFAWLNDDGTVEMLPTPVMEDGSPLQIHILYLAPLPEATQENPAFYAVSSSQVYLVKNGIVYDKTPSQLKESDYFISSAHLMVDQQLLLAVRPMGLLLLNQDGELSELNYRYESDSGFQVVRVDSRNRIWAYGNLTIDRIDYGSENQYWRLPFSETIANICLLDQHLFVSSQTGAFVAPIINRNGGRVLGPFREVLTSRLSIYLRRQHGSIYAASAKGLYQWVQTAESPDGEMKMLSDIQCHDLTIDQQGRFFVATWDDGVVQMRRDPTSADGSLELVQSYRTSPLCRLLCCDAQGDVWMHAYSHQLPSVLVQRIDAQTGEVQGFEKNLLPLIFGNDVLFTGFAPTMNQSGPELSPDYPDQIYRFDRVKKSIVPADDITEFLQGHNISAGQAFATNQDWRTPRFYVFGGHESIAEVSQSESGLLVKSARISPGQRLSRRVTGDEDGNVWVAINNKIWRTTLTTQSKTFSTSVPVQISRVEVVNPEVSLASPSHELASHLLIPDTNDELPAVTLPYTAGTLRVSYAVPGYSLPERVLYRSRMVNLNDQWSGGEYTTQRDFAALSPGDYRFEVVAKFPGNLASGTSVMRIVVLPPWYQTRVFYAACVLLLLGAVGWFYRNKTRQVRELQHEVNARMEIESRLRASQKELLRQERIQNLGEIAAGVAHDINNSLSPIMVYSELLQISPISDEAKSFCRHIDEGAADIALLLKRIQPMYRTDSSVVEPVDLTAVLRKTIQSMREQTIKNVKKRLVSIDLIIEPTSGIPLTVNCIAADIREIIWNLLNNALDAVGERGQIVVTCREIDRFAQLEVRDDGIGMKPEVLERCFDTFYSTKANRGSGLGLSTTRAVVESYGGSITVTSTVDQGTTFIVQLPLSSDGAVSDIVSSKHLANRSLKILVVDDIEATLSSLRTALEHLNHRVVGAHNGQAALELLASQDFDILITDHQMPGITGFELCQQLQQSRPELAIILLTGYEESGMREVCDAFLAKPVSMQGISRVLEEAIVKRQHRLGYSPEYQLDSEQA